MKCLQGGASRNVRVFGLSDSGDTCHTLKTCLNDWQPGKGEGATASGIPTDRYVLAPISCPIRLLCASAIWKRCYLETVETALSGVDYSG